MRSDTPILTGELQPGRGLVETDLAGMLGDPAG